MRACRRALASRCCSARPHRLGGDLLDVVYQAMQLPLRGHLGPASGRVDGVAHPLARVVDVLLIEGCAPSMGANLWGGSPLWEYRLELIMSEG